MESNRLIAEFMGMKWKPFRDDSTKNYSSYVEKLFDTFGECEKFCLGYNAANCNSAYFDTYIPMLECIECKYHTSWDWLMPVVEKIRTVKTGCIVTMIDAYGYNECIITDNWPNKHGLNIKVVNEDTLIESVYTAIVEFIKWHNNN